MSTKVIRLTIPPRSELLTEQAKVSTRPMLFGKPICMEAGVVKLGALPKCAVEVSMYGIAAMPWELLEGPGRPPKYFDGLSAKKLFLVLVPFCNLIMRNERTMKLSQLTMVVACAC